MNGCRRSTSNCAYGVRLWRRFDLAVVAFERVLDDDLHVTAVPSGSTLDQWGVSSETHLINVSSRVDVVQCAKNDIKRLEPFDVVLWIFDVIAMRCNVHARIEQAGCLLSHDCL